MANLVLVGGSQITETGPMGSDSRGALLRLKGSRFVPSFYVCSLWQSLPIRLRQGEVAMDFLFLRISSEAQLKKFEAIIAKIVDFEARASFLELLGLLDHELVFAALNREFSLIEAELEAFALSLEGKAMQ